MRLPLLWHQDHPSAAGQPDEASDPPSATAGPSPEVRTLARLAVASLVTSVALMLVTGESGASAAVPAFPPAVPLPPVPWRGHLSDTGATVLPWLALAAGAAGVAIGLVAIGRGWRPRLGPLLAAALLAVITLTLIPPVGSTDMLDYAVYGRIAALGHSPYVETPQQLFLTGDPVGVWRPLPWSRNVSVYGPLATLAGQAASALAGPSIGLTILWLKILDALAFLAIALALDWFLRSDPAARARAHLLWTVNPIMLFAVIAGGHVDGLAAAFGLLGLLCLRNITADQATARQALAAGLLLGAAIDVKADLAIFAVAAAWQARRSPRTLAALLGGSLAVLIPSYALAGPAAIIAVLRRVNGNTTVYEPWQVITGPIHYLTGVPLSHFFSLLAPTASALLLVTFICGFPAGRPGLPLARLVLACSLATLIASPLQRPWFDAIIFPLLAVMPATRMDLVLILRAAIAAAAEIPGSLYYTLLRPHWVALASDYLTRHFTPLILVGCAAALVRLCRTGAWTTGGQIDDVMPQPVLAGRASRL